MITSGINISDLFFQTYGYRSQAFEFDKIPTEGLYSSSGTAWYGKDSIGREYFLPVTLRSTSKKKDYVLPFPVISIRSRKTIVDTPMIERNGSVHEFISPDDYSLTIRGFMIGKNGIFPEDEIKELVELWRLNEALQITCVLTDMILESSQKVIITSIDFPESQGKNVKPYSMELISDQEFILEEI